MKCKFCDKEISNAANLKTHQTKTKKCLALQKKEAEIKYKCEYCEKEFTRKDAFEIHISRHLANPVDQGIQKLKQENEKLKEEIERIKQEHAREIDFLNKHIQEEIKKYDTRINKYEKTIEKLASKAISAKSVTNNNYNSNTYINIDKLTSVDTKLIGRHTPEDFTFDVICPVYCNGEMVMSGGACIAKWLLENPLKNNIWCSDIQRQTMRYRSKNEITTDKKGRKLWFFVMNMWGIYLEDYLTMTVMRLGRREGLTDDEQNFIRKLEHIKGDLSVFTQYNAETNTEKEFIKYLSENSHTKESLMRFFAEQERLVQNENLEIE